MSSESPDTWTRIHESFHDALRLDPGAREAFLAQLGTDEPAVAAEVRSLLAAHADASGFLATPATATRLAGAAPGERIGPYRVVEEIGRGGMGVVYRAVRDDDSFAKEVAIKLIDPGMRTDEILKRFRSERQILALLEHPNIARLLDGGTAPDGSPYLVMEHVAGEPLLAYCDRRRLTVERRLALFLAVCDAVQFAHQRLVVHRDLKSDNVLVTEDGSPRLLDFGIARLLSAESGEAATVTIAAHRMLTPDYASPEQIRGEPAAVSSDVYSLGVILYELLTGARPHRFTTRSPEEVLRVVTQEDPAPPSAAVTRAADEDAATRRGDTTRRLRRRLSGDLDYVVLKALEKDPARRYGSVEQLARDLRAHLDGQPVLARGGSTAYRVSRFLRRNRVAVATTSLVTLALLAGLAGTAWQARVAERRFQQVRELARAVMFDVHDAIAGLPGSTPAREVIVSHALRYLDGLTREARGDYALRHELAVAYSKIGDVQGRPMYPNLGRSADALVSYDKALALLRPLTRERPESTSVVHDEILVSQRRADLLAVMGRREDALREADDARLRVESALARRPRDELLLNDLRVAWDRLTDMRLAMGDTAGAERASSAYLAIAESGFRANPRDPSLRRGMLIAYAKNAGLLAARGERDSALAAYERAGNLAREAVGALPHDTDAARDLSIVYGMHAQFLAEGGDVDSALAVYGRAMKISEDLAAADPGSALQQADVATGHFDLGGMMRQAGRHAESEERFREAYRRFASLAAADTGNAELRACMARSSRRAGEACRAIADAAGAPAGGAARARALEWLETSLALYRELASRGALDGAEAQAPDEVRAEIAAIRR